MLDMCLCQQERKQMKIGNEIGSIKSECSDSSKKMPPVEET